MNTLMSKLTSLVAGILFAMSVTTFTNAEEINTPGFSGAINTTVTSGFTVRASERDCELSFGYRHTSVVEAWGTVYSQNGEGCSGYRTDAYGNTSTEYINIAGSNPNSDDGNLNFDQGEIINATQKFYTEVIGDANGLGVNLSLTGSYNPVNDITTPQFKKLKADALDSQEQDLTLLNAYITTEFDIFISRTKRPRVKKLKYETSIDVVFIKKLVSYLNKHLTDKDCKLIKFNGDEN